MIYPINVTDFSSSLKISEMLENMTKCVCARLLYTDKFKKVQLLLKSILFVCLFHIGQVR